MTKAITIIQTRRSATGFGLVHTHHSVLKQLKLFSTDSQALEASTCRYTPFCSVPFCALNDGYAYTGNAASSMLHGRAVTDQLSQTNPCHATPAISTANRMCMAIAALHNATYITPSHYNVSSTCSNTHS